LTHDIGCGSRKRVAADPLEALIDDGRNTFRNIVDREHVVKQQNDVIGNVPGVARQG